MLRVVTSWAGLPGGPGITQFFFDEALDPGVATAVQGAVKTLVDGLTNGIIGSVTATVESTVEEIDPATGALTGEYEATSGTYVGGTGGNPLSYQCQALIDVRTSTVLGGRRIRGRWYVPGLTEAENETGIGPRDAYVVAAGAQLAAFLAAAPSYGVWSRKNGVCVPAESVAVNPRWATLRGRLR